MTMIEEALTQTTDTKACEIGPGATEAAAKMFRGLFPDAEKAVVIDDPRTRARFRETFVGVPYMRARYFGADLVQRLGLMPALLERLFGAGGVWEVK